MLHNSSCLAGVTLLAYLKAKRGKLDENVCCRRLLIRKDHWLLQAPGIFPQWTVPPAETSQPQGFTAAHEGYSPRWFWLSPCWFWRQLTGL